MIDVYEVGARVRSEPAEADRPGSSFERDRVVVGHGDIEGYAIEML